MFNETNYRKLRAYLLTREGKFDWSRYFAPTGEGCIACACRDLAGGSLSHFYRTFGENRDWSCWTDILAFLNCSTDDAQELFACTANPKIDRDVHAAIARLDEVALRYGVRPQTESHRVAELEDARPTQSLESHSASERAVAADTAREDGSLAGSSPAPMTTFVPNEAAFLDACRQIAAGVPREQVR